MKRWFSFSLAVALFAVSGAQAADPVAAARAFVDANRATYGLVPGDTSGMTVNDSYATKHNGVTHVYFVQRHAGIAVWNGIANVNVARDGRAISMGSRFAPNLANTANTTTPSLSAATAVQRAAAHLGLLAGTPQLVQTIGGAEQSVVFAGGTFSRKNVPAKLTFYRNTATSARLAWDVIIEPDSQHIWEVLVDASSGAILHKINHVKSDTYKVFAWPSESPNHVGVGQPRPPADGRTVVSSTAADPVASPHGWHDLNGIAGADTFDTSGNNVNAQTDLDADDAYTPATDTRPLSTTRDFQPPLDLNQFASSYIEAAVVNLFYWNNVNHDLHYRYGFDEPAGNFQLNNYTLGGLGADALEADAQDGSGTNNANMATPPDGQAPRMQMYVWTPTIANQVAIHSPAGLGPYPASAAAFGPPLDETGITGDVVLAVDGLGAANDACEAITNDLTGKIAFVDRGTCNFILKVQNAQAAGAIGVIVANNQPGEPLTMGGTEDPANPVTIPSVMITQGAGDELRVALPANATLSNVSASIPTRDSDFDNGVIIHEYGHGVSTRLTGGPSTSSCLENLQQGGEGWSDFWAMAFTQRAGSTGAEARPMGSYVVYEDNAATARGIRPFPYSTDLRVNPQTYGHLARGTLSVPHGVGSVWATMLWELYWAIVNGVPSHGLPGYGFRENLYDLTAPLAGNQIALQLVTDGLKFQPCNPSFVDARNAILQADEASYGGKYKWHIWWAFAKRGVGAGALDDGGGLDVRESFAMPAGAPGACQEPPAFGGLQSVVSATDGTCALLLNWSPATSDPCSSGRVTYSVYRSTTASFEPSAATRIASGIDTTTFIDEGVVAGTRFHYVVRAVDGFGNEDVNRSVVSEVPAGALAAGGSFSDDGGAARFTPAGGWAVRSTGGVLGSKVYATSSSGNYVDGTCAQLTSETIYLGSTPSLSFATKYDIEPTWDAGIVEVSTAASGFRQWKKLALNYPGIIVGADGSVLACPGANGGFAKGERAFSGTSLGQFLTVTGSLAEYANQAVRIRFYFASDGASNDLGWFVDNISVTGVQQPGACNTRPNAVNDAASVAEDNAVAINVLANDADGNGDALTVTSASTPSHGATRVNADNTITYTPAANYHGSDSFTYSIRDTKGATDTATVSVTVTSVNDLPVANNDSGPVVKNSGTDFGVLDNDFDADGDTLRVTAVTNPSNGTARINTNNTIRYTPRKGFKGTDSFTYIVSDGNGGTASATVTVSVTKE